MASWGNRPTRRTRQQNERGYSGESVNDEEFSGCSEGVEVVAPDAWPLLTLFPSQVRLCVSHAARPMADSACISSSASRRAVVIGLSPVPGRRIALEHKFRSCLWLAVDACPVSWHPPPSRPVGAWALSSNSSFHLLVCWCAGGRHEGFGCWLKTQKRHRHLQ